MRLGLSILFFNALSSNVTCPEVSPRKTHSLSESFCSNLALIVDALDQLLFPFYWHPNPEQDLFVKFREIPNILVNALQELPNSLNTLEIPTTSTWLYISRCLLHRQPLLYRLVYELKLELTELTHLCLPAP